MSDFLEVSVFAFHLLELVFQLADYFFIPRLLQPEYSRPTHHQSHRK